MSFVVDQSDETPHSLRSGGPICPLNVPVFHHNPVSVTVNENERCQ